MSLCVHVHVSMHALSNGQAPKCLIAYLLLINSVYVQVIYMQACTALFNAMEGLPRNTLLTVTMPNVCAVSLIIMPHSPVKPAILLSATASQMKSDL